MSKVVGFALILAGLGVGVFAIAPSDNLVEQSQEASSPTSGPVVMPEKCRAPSTSLATHWLVLSFHKGIENCVGLLDRQARVHAIDERFHGATCGLRPDPTYVPLIATHAP